MIEFLKGKATALLGIALLVMLGMFLMVKSDLSTTTTALTNANSEKQVLQTDSDRLASEVTELSKQVAYANAERDRLATALKSTEQSKQQLSEQYAVLDKRMTVMLQEATDEHTQNWRNDYVPDDAVKLLVSAADCAQYPDSADCLRTDAGSIYNAVPRYTSGSAGNPVPTAKLRQMSFKPGNVVADNQSLRRSWQM
jgi:uncharacterized protein YoxC